MPQVDNSWVRAAALWVGLITLARVVLLAFNQTDLFVDEAQYWLWGEEPAFGYYSKPPLIGWTIALSTLFSEATFWVRLPAPLLHGITAMILGAIAARLFDARTALVTALAYVTTPMVALASLLISTDTVMFPFLAGAFLVYLKILDDPVPRTRDALFCGALLGGAFLGKYAALYFPICAALAALFFTRARPSWPSVALIALAFLIVISPNLIWNLANGLTTLSHTLDNADWVRDPNARAGLHFDRLAEFFFAQFGVVGPVLFFAILMTAVTAHRQSSLMRMLLVFSLPILAIVCVQALLSRAYANWAVATYIAGIVIAISWLLPRHRAWLYASFGFNGLLCLILPIAALVPEDLTLRGEQLLARYTGRAAMSEAIVTTAEEANVTHVVASNRDVLADLFYTARESGLTFAALPTLGRAPHHYALKYPFEAEVEQVLFILPAGATPPCPDQAEKRASFIPEDGAYRRHPQDAYLLPGACLIKN